MNKDRRLWILASLILAVALSFWGTSRYPSLDAKSSMSGAVALQDSLSFEAVFNTSAVPDLATKIAYTFGNWVYINWQGMAFGLILALLFMTALPLLRESYSQSRMGSTLIGSLIGIPLGLCVNCSAPIAYGIYRGGGRVETALATMLSSPALNVVVIGMSVALLPFYLWATKLFFSLLLIFVLVPILASRLKPEAFGQADKELDRETSKETGKTLNSELLSPKTEMNESLIPLSTDIHPYRSFPESIKWVSTQLLKNSFSLCIKMIPLMLLAGLLAAILVNLIPWERLIGILPVYNLPMIIIAMILLAGFAVFLPVPVAFDIILVATLVAAGLPDRYAGILLFGLGSFSVYSFFVLIKAQLTRVAIVLTISVLCLTVMVGFVSHYSGMFHSLLQKKVWFDLVRNQTSWEHEYQDVTGLYLVDIPAESFAPLLVERVINEQAVDEDSKITEVSLNQSNSTENSAWTMTQVELGLQSAPTPVFWSNVAPYSAFGGLAVGDVNQDGWPDLAKGGYAGVDIYLNLGGHFQLVEMEVLSDFKQVTFVAFADLDNDGDSDLIFSLFTGEKYVAYSQVSKQINSKNQSGEFSSVIQIEGASKAYPTSVAIADLDQNGQLDLLFGNETVADLINVSTAGSINTLYLQQDGRFAKSDFPEDWGATLSLLVSDIDADNQPDIFVGNDFDSPDRYYEYDSQQEAFTPWGLNQLSEVTRTTMSIDSADIDNDLNLEFYLAQVSMESPDNQHIEVERQASVYEQNYGRLLYGLRNPFGDLDQMSIEDCAESLEKCEARAARSQINTALRSQDLSKCSSLSEPFIWPCAVVTVHEMGYRLARIRQVPLDCENLGQSIPEVLLVCERMSKHLSGAESTAVEKHQLTNEFSQNSLTNILLKKADSELDSSSAHIDKAEAYMDIAEVMGIAYSGWSWNAKFADLDGDQWQDLFVVNGWYQMRADTSNVFFKNQQSGKFDIHTSEAGLVDYDPTTSSVYIDIDMDGDMDLVTLNIFGELRSYLNQNSNQHIQIELDDQLGNRAGIGARVFVYYGEDQHGEPLHQLREIKLSGGYLSFDQPIAHFGLGQHKQVQRIEVSLLDGREYSFEKKFLAGNRYRLRLD